MNRPLWKDFRRLRHTGRESPLGQVGQVVHRPQFKRALGCALFALAAVIVGSSYGSLQSPMLHRKIIALAAAIVFLLSSILAVRSVAREIARAVESRAGRTAGSTVQVAVTATGFILILFVTLDLLDVSVQHLLLGGAITGVILGIALQQTLANVFAGLVLMLAEPFTLGEHVRIRSGALGGEFYGTIVAVTLTYVVVETRDGVLHVPNAGVLAAAVGPYPRPEDVHEPVAADRHGVAEAAGKDADATAPSVAPDQSTLPFPPLWEAEISAIPAFAAQHLRHHHRPRRPTP